LFRPRPLPGLHRPGALGGAPVREPAVSGDQPAAARLHDAALRQLVLGGVVSARSGVYLDVSITEAKRRRAMNTDHLGLGSRVPRGRNSFRPRYLVTAALLAATALIPVGAAHAESHELVWARELGGPSRNTASAVVVDAAGSVIVVGTTI